MPKLSPSQKQLALERFQLKEGIAALNRAKSDTEANTAANAIVKTVLRDINLEVRQTENRRTFAKMVAALHPAAVENVGIKQAVESQQTIDGTELEIPEVVLERLNKLV